MLTPNLLPNVSVREIGAPVAAASNTDSNSDRIDMANWEGVLFVCPIEDSVATGVATLTIEQNAADSDTGMADLPTAVATAACVANDDLNGKLLVVDVFRPRERYLQAVRTAGTANIAFGTVTAILYGPRKTPVDAHTTVLQQVTVASPSE